ncbi:E3 ubiquitin-protein ligase SSM4 [Gigaspora margarita]|uniref:E3 ubiquitin-protein ligase SSM4 n=1 Tax=Gigaspora margarita TaxID=4874 RepID=A0A8H4A683_GIGMA|nr:E3 ubiquitin-protein ligase SSM4 [Gigaspora margarita]
MEDKMCRICFAGPEKEESLGRLIPPCLCKGTMRYVHVESKTDETTSVKTTALMLVANPSIATNDRITDKKKGATYSALLFKQRKINNHMRSLYAITLTVNI